MYRPDLVILMICCIFVSVVGCLWLYKLENEWNECVRKLYQQVKQLKDWEEM